MTQAKKYNRTTRNLSITIPENLCKAVDVKLNSGFGVPKGAWSGFLTALVQAWLEESGAEISNPLDDALEQNATDGDN